MCKLNKQILNKYTLVFFVSVQVNWNVYTIFNTNLGVDYNSGFLFTIAGVILDNKTYVDKASKSDIKVI